MWSRRIRRIDADEEAHQNTARSTESRDVALQDGDTQQDVDYATYYDGAPTGTLGSSSKDIVMVHSIT